MTTTTAPAGNNGLVKAILITGLLAGALDITAAIIHFAIVTQRGPAPIFIYIASGVFGSGAYAEGVNPTMMMLAGLIFHFIIALGWTTVYYVLYPHIAFLGRNAVVSGLLYGIIVWAAMNLLVLPVSNVNRGPIRFPQALIGVAILMVMVGLPVAVRARQFYSTKS